MPDQHRPVFVDPSGRRRRVVRTVAVLGVALTVGYLALVLLAAFGGPTSPAARLPLLPDGPAANPRFEPVPAAVAPPVPETSPTGDGPDGATTTVVGSQPPEPTAAAPTSTRRGRTPIKPTEPPGNGRPTDPPGSGG